MTETQGAIIAGCVTILASILTTIDNNHRKKDELFFKALDFQGGSVQERNLGIAAVEISLKNKKHMNLCRKLLIGSAIFILTESKHRDSRHELYNLGRIMKLLLEGQPEKSLTQNYKDLLDALEHRRVEHEDLTEWKKGPK